MSALNGCVMHLPCGSSDSRTPVRLVNLLLGHYGAFWWAKHCVWLRQALNYLAPYFTPKRRRKLERWQGKPNPNLGKTWASYKTNRQVSCEIKTHRGNGIICLAGVNMLPSTDQWETRWWDPQHHEAIRCRHVNYVSYPIKSPISKRGDNIPLRLEPKNDGGSGQRFLTSSMLLHIKKLQTF